MFVSILYSAACYASVETHADLHPNAKAHVHTHTTFLSEAIRDARGIAISNKHKYSFKCPRRCIKHYKGVGGGGGAD